MLDYDKLKAIIQSYAKEIGNQPMGSEKLQKLQELLKLVQNDTVRPEEIKQFLEVIVGVIKKQKEEFATLSAESLQTIKDSVSYVETKHNVLEKRLDKTIDEKEREINERISINKGEFARNLKEVKDFLNEVKKIKVTPGKDGVNGRDGLGIDGKNGKDGSPDARLQIVEKINTGDKNDLKIEASQVVGFDKAKKDLDFALGVLDQRTQFLINKVGGGTIKSLVAGTGVSIDSSDPANPIISAPQVGTITTVSVVTANGISGSVATATTTPAITLDISALDATKIANGSVSNTEFQYLDGVTSAIQTQLDAKVTSVSGTSNRITSTGGTTPAIDISATYVGQTSITTLGTIGTGTWQGTSISTTYTDAKIKTVTGTANRLTIGGTATDPTFDISTSYVGQATITTLGTIATGVWNGSVIAGTYGGTGVNNSTKTFTYLKNISFTAADDTGVYTLPTGTKTIPSTADNLSVFAATTSLQLKGVISDETGSGALVFANTPSLVTPDIGAATGTSLALSGAIGQLGGTQGVTLSAATGVLTMAGIGNTNNESLTFDLESVANKVTLGTGTGVTLLGLPFTVQVGTTTGINVSGALGVLTIAGVGNTNNESLILNFEQFANIMGVSSGTGITVSTWTFAIRFNDNIQSQWGSGAGGDVGMEWDTAETNNSLKMGLTLGSSAQSGNFIICENADINTNFGAGIRTDPTLRIQSADATTTSDFIQFFHDQSRARIQSGDGLIGIGGVGKTNNEDLLFDFETTANTVGVSSGTGVTLVSFGTAISLAMNTIELGHATQNTLSAASGVLSIEGVVIPTISSTNTMTNKRRQPRVYTAASNTSLTPEIDTYDVFHVTALAGAIAINNHSTSTPADGEMMLIRLLDNATARAITFGTNYVAKAGTALPTTTVLSKNMVMLFEYNGNLAKWNLLSLGQET